MPRDPSTGKSKRRDRLARTLARAEAAKAGAKRAAKKTPKVAGKAQVEKARAERLVAGAESPSPRPGQDPAGFPVVGLGASAGGLAALEKFFAQVPVESGMAYVVVTHQSPDRTTLSPDLLAKRTRVPVRIAADHMRLAPNNIYVAPPGCCIEVCDEQLRVTRAEQGVPHLPIDQFFRSLAMN